MKRILISLLATISITAQANVENTEDNQRVYNEAIKEMLLELQASKDKANKALKVNDTETFSQYQCKLLNNIINIIEYSKKHPDLKGAAMTETKFQDILKNELAPFKMANMTKDDICNAATGLPESSDMLPTE